LPGRDRGAGAPLGRQPDPAGRTDHHWQTRGRQGRGSRQQEGDGMTSVDKSSTTTEDTAEKPSSGGHVAPDDLAALTSTAPVAGSTADYFRLYVQRVRGGDMGSLPAVTGLIVLAAFFSIVHPSFHSIFNFGNMFTEGTGTIF